MIEPLPEPSSSQDRKKKHDTESVKIRSSQKPSKNLLQSNDDKPFLISSTNTSSKIQDHHKKLSTSKRKYSNEENVVLDKFGRSMTVRPETIKVLKQLPDISFLSARTLLLSPEQKHVVPDLGAMINRKMPG